MTSSEPLARGRELAAVDAAIADDVRLLVVHGDAGVGKTVLARQIVSRVRQRGRPAELVLATRAARRIAFGAMAHLLGENALSTMEAAVAQGADAGQTGLRLLLAALRLRRHTGLVLCVDDVDLLDDSSAVLLGHLVGSSEVTVVAALRSGESPPPPLAPVLDEASTRHLTVQAMTREDLARVAARTLGAPLDPDLRAQLWRVSTGNPLLAVQTLQAARDRGSVVLRAGTWSATDLLQPCIDLASVIRGRLTELTSAQIAAAETIAFAEPLEVAIAERVTDAGAVEQLERRGVIRPHEESGRLTVRLDHPLFGEALRGALPVTRRRHLAHSLASAINEVGARRYTDPIRRAAWLLDSGRGDEPATLTLAAGRALGLGDAAAAEEFSRAAIALTDDPRPRIMLGQALALLGHHDAAERQLSETTPGLSPDLTVTVAVARARNLFWGMGRTEDADRVLVDAERNLPPGDLQHRLRAMRAAMLVFRGHFAAAHSLAGPIVTGCPDDVARVSAFVALQVVWMVQGRFHKAVADNEHWIELARSASANAPLAVFQIEAVAAHSGAFLGDEQRAFRTPRSRYECEAGLSRSSSLAGLWGLHVAWNSLRYAGRVRDALAVLHEAMPQLVRTDPFDHLALHAMLLGEALALTGDDEGASRQLALAAPHVGDRNAAFHPSLDLCAAWMRAAAGRTASAIKAAMAVAQRCRAAGDAQREILLLDAVARWGRPADVCERLAHLAAATDGPVVQALAGAAAAAVRAAPDDLTEHALSLAAHGWLLHAADHQAVAAVLFDRCGDPLNTARAISRARVLYDDAGTSRTPAGVRLRAVDPLARLSPREREVALMAARSPDTNAALAEELYVAKRTVDNHLARVYGKTGVTGREELRELVSLLMDQG